MLEDTIKEWDHIKKREKKFAAKLKAKDEELEARDEIDKLKE